MAGIRKTPLQNGKFQAWFTDYLGKIKFFTGTHSKAETLRIAQKLEDDNRQIKVGYRPAPKPFQKHSLKEIEIFIQEYISWGTIQGGRHGMPWGKTHLKNRNSQLSFWKKELDLKTLGDLENILPSVEKILRDLRTNKKTPKTCRAYSETLKAFCKWCLNRDYLEHDPLKKLSYFDKTPQVTRRAMTPEEIKNLLEVAPDHRRLLYEVAMSTGLRAGELKALTLKHLDLERCGIILEAQWTKNRQPGFQPLPSLLAEKLFAVGVNGSAKILYEKFYNRKDLTNEYPDKPLLFVSSKTCREFDFDCNLAGITKQTDKGKLDFHALRVVYITYILEAGATVKEAQTLARHSIPELTMNVYAKTRDSRLSELTENIGKKLFPEDYLAISLHKQAVGENQTSHNSFNQPNLTVIKTEWRRRESNPRP